MAQGMLEVVNEAGEIIGLKTRTEIHQQGLRHREVHVFLVTPQAEIVFQRRSPTIESFPNCLGASAGGHVEIGQSYLQSALMEVEEELGLNLNSEDLHPIDTLDIIQKDGDKFTNKVFRAVFIYHWSGKLEELRVEESFGSGFQLINLSDLIQMKEDSFGDLVPNLVSPAYHQIWLKIQTIIST